MDGKSCVARPLVCLVEDPSYLLACFNLKERHDDLRSMNVSNMLLAGGVQVFFDA